MDYEYFVSKNLNLNFGIKSLWFFSNDFEKYLIYFIYDLEAKIVNELQWLL